jgi:hypothetical protein
MHYRNAKEKDYPQEYQFDRSYMSAQKKKKLKNLKPEGGVTGQLDRLAKPAGQSMHSHVGWRDIRAKHEILNTGSSNDNAVAQEKALNKALKAGQQSNWVELQAGGLENQRKQYEHLLSILQDQLCAEIQRHSGLNRVSLGNKKARYRVHARVARERAEASDWIVRILKKYGMMSALEEASYLTASCKSLLDNTNMQYSTEEDRSNSGGRTRLAQTRSAPAGLNGGGEEGTQQTTTEFMRNLEHQLSLSESRTKAKKQQAKARQAKKSQKRAIPGHIIPGKHAGAPAIDYTLPAVKHDIYSQRRRQRAGIGAHHTGQDSLLKSHAATEILWQLDRRDKDDVELTGSYTAGRLGGKDLFMQLTNSTAANKAYSYTMSQQLDAFTNFGNQNPSTLPAKVPSPPPGSPVGSPRYPPSVFQHAPGFYTNGQPVRLEGRVT